MNDYITKALVLMAFALVLLITNLKAGTGSLTGFVLKVLSYFGLLACLGGSGYFVFQAVIA